MGGLCSNKFVPNQYPSMLVDNNYYIIFYRCVEYSILKQMNGKDPNICNAKRIPFLTSVLSRISSHRHPWISDDPPLREKELDKMNTIIFTLNYLLQDNQTASIKTRLEGD